MRPFLSSLAALAALTPSIAAAQTPPRTQDLRCVVVMAQIGARAADPAMKTATAMGAMYYLGRLKGREPALQLKPLVEAEFVKMSIDDLKAEAARCSAEMQTLSKETADISAALKAKGGAQ